jgi:phenylacetic acid degradation operon negative regulatory protein
MQEGNTEGGAKPLTARSVLASALLGEDPPELPVAHLVHLAGLFGISGNRARVALSRMVAAGEVVTNGNGRYRLTGHLLDRLGRQTASRSGEMRPWSGRWHMAVVTGSGRAAEERQTRRRDLALARLAEYREGVWLRPDNIDLVPNPGDDPHLTLFAAAPVGDPVALAAGLWDLAGWDQRARGLLGQLEALPPSDPADLAPGFELSAAVLRHLQADPLLPTELLPVGWAGTELRVVYGRWDQEYRRVLAVWARSA